MDLGLNQSAAFVAGASSGLGRAIAKQLLMEGCRVAICSRSQGRVDMARDWLLSETNVAPDQVLAIACDVTQESQIISALDKAESTFGHLNLLVTNAGGPPTGQIDDLSSDAWRDAIELNLMSTINLSRHGLPALKRARERGDHASILMITSLSAKQPIPLPVSVQCFASRRAGFRKKPIRGSWCSGHHSKYHSAGLYPNRPPQPLKRIFECPNGKSDRRDRSRLGCEQRPQTDWHGGRIRIGLRVPLE